MMDEGELGVSPVAMETLEREFQDALRELSADEHLERFRLEYEKLHRAFRKSYESERRLLRRCNELNSEIVAQAAKVQTAMKLSGEDQSTIVALKREVDKAWRMVDAAQEKEARGRDTIQQLKREIGNLSLLVEQGAGLTAGQESTVSELLKVKEELTTERDMLSAQITALRRDIADTHAAAAAAAADSAARQAEAAAVREQLAAARREHEAEARVRENAFRELRELRRALEARGAELKVRAEAIEGLKKDVAAAEGVAAGFKADVERVQRDYDATVQRLQQHTRSMEEEIAQSSAVASKCAQLRAELNLRDHELARLSADLQAVQKQRERDSKVAKRLEAALAASEASVGDARAQISALEHAAALAEKERAELRRQVDDVLRERDAGHRRLVRAEATVTEKEAAVGVENARLRAAETELAAHRQEAHARRKLVFRLEAERERYAAAASAAAARYAAALDEIKAREAAATDAERQVAEAAARLRRQQQLYEAVRADRNVYSKSLAEAHDELAEMRRKFQVVSHQIDQLKEEVAAKDRAMIDERTAQKAAAKAVDALRAELHVRRTHAEAQSAKISSLQSDVAALTGLVGEADGDRAALRRKLGGVMAERDVLSGQLVRRNDELALLHEASRIQQAALAKGKADLRELMVDLHMVRLDLKESQRNCHLAQTAARDGDGSRKMAAALQRALLAERARVRALSDELAHPQNVHRWRTLEATDPRGLELHSKVQSLQKRLLAKTEECLAANLALAEKDRLYAELKGILARQPGPEVAAQLNLYHETLRRRNAQLRTMAAELNAAASHTAELRYEYERRTRELQASKKDYLAMRSRNVMLLRERATLLLAPHGATAPPRLRLGAPGKAAPLAITGPPPVGEPLVAVAPPGGLPRVFGAGFSAGGRA